VADDGTRAVARTLRAEPDERGRELVELGEAMVHPERVRTTSSSSSASTAAVLPVGNRPASRGVAMLATRFTERFGVDQPIMAAPMGGPSDGRLAAAVSETGALGSLQAISRTKDAAWVVEQVALARAATVRPFAVGFITEFIRFDPGRFEAVLEQHVPVIALSFGEPGPYIAAAHDAGSLAICQVQTLRQAVAAVDAGTDALAAQGTEAGGHTGTMGLLPLLGSVLDECPDVPVLAAGGVANGRTLAGVLAMGADGAWIGSAFLATTEASPDDPRTKDLIVASDGTDTVLTHVYDILDGMPWPSGIGDRVRANDFTARWGGQEDVLRTKRDSVDRPTGDNLDERDVRYGQSAALVHAVKPAADVVREIVADAERFLARYR
jgi:nitronate monooxygenase